MPVLACLASQYVASWSLAAGEETGGKSSSAWASARAALAASEEAHAERIPRPRRRAA